MSAFQSVYRKLERGLNQEGCTISRFQILFHLYFEGNLPATGIAEKLFVTRGNISMFIRRLQEEKLVMVSKESPSAKRPLYCLTAAGIELFEDIFPRHIRRVKSSMPVLSREAQRDMALTLEKSLKS